jgi:hypothetical protein
MKSRRILRLGWVVAVFGLLLCVTARAQAQCPM